MDKNLNFKIIVQTSEFDWHGSKDMSMRIIDGKPVLYWVLRKICKHFPNTKIALAVPSRDKNSEIKNILLELNNKYISLVTGPSDDVLTRLIFSTKDLSEDDYFVRILGLHYFFDPDITKNLLKHVQTDKCYWAKPQDDFEIQLTSEVVKVKALKDLDNYLKNNKVKNESSIRVSPLHFISSNYLKDRGHIINNLPLPKPSEKKSMREKALKIYHLDRTAIKKKALINAGAQLTFHYETALNFIPKNARILDIACGDGFGSQIVSPKASIVVGADIDMKIISQAQKNNFGKNITYLTADAQKLPFPSNSFDTVLSMETIEHVNANRFLKEIKRVLKPKGFLIISTPQNRSGKYPINPFHNHEYSLEEFSSLINSFFNTIKIIGIKTGRLVIENDPVGTNTMVIAENNKI